MYKNAWRDNVVVLPIGAVTRDTYDPLTGGNWSGACDRTLPPLFTSPSGDSCIMFPVCIRLHELIPTQSHSGMSSFRFSIQIKFSFWYEISFWFHVNWTRNSFPIEIAPRLIWSEWRMRNWSGAKTCTIRFYHVNTIWTSFWNETHSGVKIIRASQKQPLSWVHYVFCRYLWAWLDLFQRLLLLNK